MEKRKLLLILLAVGLYVLSTGISYAVFSGSQKNFIKAEVPISEKGKTAFDDALPKTEPCPLNGQKYSKEQRAWWEKHGPLGVMIENHENARPQSGLGSTDVVYEAVAEGGITRFLAVFYCQDAEQVGPVRSARTYFLDFISEYGDYPLYAHVGGANTPGPANALGQIGDYGWNSHNDMNQFSIGFPTFWRDYDRLGHTTETEHTMYSSTTKLWDFANKKRDLTNVDENGVAWDENFVPYTFTDEAGTSARGKAQAIHLEFWEGYQQYAVDWTHDPTTNVYKRAHGGEPQLDRNTNKPIDTKNLVVVSVIESHANDGYEGSAHLLYKTKGTGKATIFMDGKKISGTWKKDGRTSRMQILDASGTPIKFVRGRIWFAVLPTDGILEVK